MNKIILVLLGTVLFTACSDDGNYGAVNQASTGSGNNEATSCNYTFECESDIQVKNGVIYTSNDSIVFSGQFLYKGKHDDWTLSNFMKRLEETYGTSFTLKDTLLTETQLKEKQHKAAFELSMVDFLVFAIDCQQEDTYALVTNSYDECRKNDPACYVMYQASLEDEATINAEISRDVENFTKLCSLDLKRESTCKLTNTECK